MGITLYPDQQELLDSLRASIRRGNRSVLLQAATGSGKTQISAKIIAGSRAKGTRSIFIVPRKELRRQTSLTLDNHDIPHSFISAGMPFNPFSKTFVATVGTLQKRYESIPDIDLLICDEIHHAGDGMDKIIKFYKQRGAIIIGLSATPKKLSGKGLDCWFDDMVCGKSIRWLIDNKRLADYKAFIIDIPDLSMIPSLGGDYNQGRLSAKMESDRMLVGSAVKTYKENAVGKLGVTYTTSRKHSEIVAEEYRNAGIPAANIDGTMDDAERSRIIKSFARREILQLVNCELLTFGFDLASASGMDVTIETLTDLQPTQSLAKQLQKWGRVLRYKQEPALIFDHSGNVMNNKGETKHGFPCQDRDWSLQGETKGKREGVERAIPICQCMKCYFAFRPNIERKCPNCGYILPVREHKIKTVEGELKEVKAGEVVMKPPPDRVGQRRVLMNIARKKGIKDAKKIEAFVNNIINKQIEKGKL